MVSIYCIEDINDLKYVGSTSQKLNIRLSEHKSEKNRTKRKPSSYKLNLYNCIIYELERCDESNRKEREQYWINRIDCVNILNTVFDKKEYQKEYREKNKEQLKEYEKERNKLDWYCSDCKCSVKNRYKSEHLKTEKHLNNIKKVKESNL